MEPIIVTVKRDGDDVEYDLVVRPEVPVSRLSAFICEGLHWNTDERGQTITYEVEATNPSRKLTPQATLADAQAWDGTRLVFHPVNPYSVIQAAGPVREKEEKEDYVLGPAQEHPVIGRRKLRIPATHETPEADEHKDSNGYIFKQIDKD